MLLLWLNTLTTELKRTGTLIRAYQIFPSKVGTCLILHIEIGPDLQLEGIGTVKFSLAVPNTVPSTVPSRFGKKLKLNSPVKSLLFSHLPCPALQNFGREKTCSRIQVQNLVLCYCVVR